MGNWVFTVYRYGWAGWSACEHPLLLSRRISWSLRFPGDVKGIALEDLRCSCLHNQQDAQVYDIIWNCALSELSDRSEAGLMKRFPQFTTKQHLKKCCLRRFCETRFTISFGSGFHHLRPRHTVNSVRHAHGRAWFCTRTLRQRSQSGGPDWRPVHRLWGYVTCPIRRWRMLLGRWYVRQLARRLVRESSVVFAICSRTLPGMWRQVCRSWDLPSASPSWSSITIRVFSSVECLRWLASMVFCAETLSCPCLSSCQAMGGETPVCPDDPERLSLVVAGSKE